MRPNDSSPNTTDDTAALRARIAELEAALREAMGERAKIVAYMRAEAILVRHSDSLNGAEWCDAIRWMASKLELREDEHRALGEEARGG